MVAIKRTFQGIKCYNFILDNKNKELCDVVLNYALQKKQMERDMLQLSRSAPVSNGDFKYLC